MTCPTEVCYVQVASAPSDAPFRTACAERGVAVSLRVCRHLASSAIVYPATSHHFHTPLFLVPCTFPANTPVRDAVAVGQLPTAMPD